MTEVDDYFVQVEPERQEAMNAVRALIHDVVPDARETFDYKMPTFVTTDIVCSLASQKQYMALYVCDIDLRQDYKEELAHLNCGKSCIRFKKLDDLPMDTIRRIIAHSAENPGF